MSIIETVSLCARLNIPLRGHRDSFHEIDHPATSSQHGNFWAILQFRVASGDIALKEHLAHAARNATYTSSRNQNEVLDILGKTVRIIVERFKKAVYYTVIADEITDCSNKEQLSIVLWYINPEDNMIREDSLNVTQGSQKEFWLFHCFLRWGLTVQTTWSGL